jgi:CheY-like chemotaxis protein
VTKEAALAAHTILAIDDQPMTLELLVELFAGAGSSTISAEHGAQSLLLLETTQPDVIVTIC